MRRSRGRMSQQRRQAGYGQGIVELDLEGLELLSEADVVQRLLAIFRAPTYRPPKLPQAAVQLLELTRRSDVAVSSIVGVLQNDQLLTAEVLRIAQSAQFSGQGGQAVRTLDEAIMRLGLRRTADLFLQASMNLRVFRVKGYEKPMEALRRHSSAVAALSRLVSRQTSVYDEHAFLCGLLHDVGVAASMIALAESAPRGKPAPDFEFVWPAIAKAHQETGAVLAKLWGLPGEVAFVIEHHHDFIVGGYPHPTAATVCVANWLAGEVGAGFMQENNDNERDHALAALGLSLKSLERISEQARALVAEL